MIWGKNLFALERLALLKILILSVHLLNHAAFAKATFVFQGSTKCSSSKNKGKRDKNTKVNVIPHTQTS